MTSQSMNQSLIRGNEDLQPGSYPVVINSRTIAPPASYPVVISSRPIAPPAQHSMVDESIGPFFSTQAEDQIYTTKWSDGLFECFSDLASCLLCTFPCLWPVLVYETLTRLSKVQSVQQAREPEIQLPFGFKQVSTVVWVYIVATVAFLVFDQIYLTLPFYLLMCIVAYQIHGLVARHYKLLPPDGFMIFLQSF